MTSPETPRGIPPLAPTRPSSRALRWRRKHLLLAGYDELTAHRLAVDRQVDVHALVVLKERGGESADACRAARDDSEGPVAGWTT